MKKIIKIAALILALICIGTSFASCGESKEDLASEIKSSMTLTINTINYSNDSSQNTSKTYDSSDLFGTDILYPRINAFYIYVLLNEKDRTLTIDFRDKPNGYEIPGKTVYTINLPVQIKSTSYGTISTDGYSVVAEYGWLEVRTINSDIIITY